MDSDDEYNKNFGNPAGLTGFLDAEDFDDSIVYTPSSASSAPGSAASSAPGSAASSAPGSAASSAPAYMILKCKHGLKRNSCSQCFKEHNELRKSFGYAPEAWGIFCKHGRNKYVNKRLAKKDPHGLGPCGDPECIATKSYEYQQQRLEYAGNPEQQVPSASLPSLKPMNLFETKVFYSSDEDEMGGGGRGKRKYRKSRSIKKSKKLSRKARKSSRKARKSSRKTRKSSRKA